MRAAGVATAVEGIIIPRRINPMNDRITAI